MWNYVHLSTVFRHHANIFVTIASSVRRDERPYRCVDRVLPAQDAGEVTGREGVARAYYLDHVGRRGGDEGADIAA